MRLRLLLALVGISTLAIVAFAVPLGIAERTRIRGASESQLRREADRIARLLPTDFRSRTFTIPQFTDHPALRAAVFDVSGARLAGRGPDRADALTQQAGHGETSCGAVDAFLVCVQPILNTEDVVGMVRVAEPRSLIEDRVRRRTLALSAGAIGVLALAVLAALAGARRLARPITSLHDAALKLGSGDFALTLAPSGIAEMDQTANALIAAAKRLGSSLERERAFSADVSHQLRTPITSLRATLEAEQLAPRSDARLLVNEALRDVERLESTVSQLLALTRDAPLDRQNLHVDTILQQATATWGPLLHHDHRELRCEPLPVGLGDVRASRSAIEQILDVLISNARQHGAGCVTISASPSSADGVSIHVSDEGAGIDGEIDSVFRRRSPDAHGHGIGLSFAATLARAEGGRLILEATGPRPTFRLTLPPADGAGAPTQRLDRLG